MLKKLNVYLSITIIAINVAIGQEFMRFGAITIEDGLSQSVGTSIIQDSTGYVWVGTSNGLNRLEGKTIRNFWHQAEDSSSLSNSEVTDIQLDDRGQLWIGTKNGINRFLSARQCFKRYYPGDERTIVKIINHSQYGLIAVTKNALAFYNAQLDSFVINYLPNTDVHSACEIPGNALALGTASGLYRYNIYSQELRIIDKQFGGLSVESLLYDKNSLLWIGTMRNGLYSYNLQQGNILHYAADRNCADCLSSPYIRDIYQNSKGRIWIATERGLNLFRPESNNFYHYFQQSDLPGSLTTDFIRSIYQDSNGVLWIGNIGGVNIYDPTLVKFNHRKSNNKDNMRGGVSDNPLWAIEIDHKNRLWLGSMAQGLHYIGLDSLQYGQFTIIRANEKANTGLPDNTVYALEIAPDSIMWLGTGKGLAAYDLINDNFIDKHRINEENSRLPGNLLISIMLDKYNNLWLGTTRGLAYYEPKEQRLTPIDFKRDEKEREFEKFVMNLSPGLDNKLIISTRAGIKILDLDLFYQHDSISIQHQLSYANGSPVQFSNELVISTHQTDDKKIWICTISGLDVYSPQTKTIRQYKVTDGLPSNVVYNVIPDSSGKFWIPTNQGLSHFDPQTEQFVNYTVADGVQSMEFNGNCHEWHPDGRFFIGGLNGFNWFYPDSLPANTIAPKVVFTRFDLYQNEVQIDQKVKGEVILDSAINYKSSIKLDYLQNFFTIHFAALHYSNLAENKFAYRLDGIDKDWNHVGNQDFAPYTNVPPGNYTFRVKAANGDGYWGKEHTIKISIKPPFWQTYWFYVVAGLTLVLLIVLFEFMRITRLRGESKRLQNMVDKRTKQLIENQQKLKEQNMFIESIIDNAKDGIVVIDEYGYFKLANQAFVDMLGYSEKQLYKLKYQEITPEKWHEFDGRDIRKVFAGEAIYYEKEYLHSDGRIIPVGIAAAPIRKSKDARIIAIITNITERKQIEAELADYREHLEHLVQERTEDLLKAKEEAEKANRLKTVFLANLSHELRTPMNSIFGFSQLLEMPDITKKERLEFSQQIAVGSKKLLQLMEQILELSRLENAEIKLYYGATKPNEILDQLKIRFEPMVGPDVKFIVKKTKQNNQISIDKIRLQQVMDALTDNAIKFTEKGRIEIGYFTVKKKKHLLCFYVQDTGMGIRPEIQEDIFKSFAKFDADEHELTAGAGIGLAIAQKLLQLMSGTIRVESKPGKGSIFLIEIPVEKPNASGANNDDTLNTNDMAVFKDKNILIVEDEELNYLFIKEVLNGFSVNIMWATDGAQAVEYCTVGDNKIDLVLMDIKMPVMDGLEATKIIKLQNPDLPIIMQTAYAMQAEKATMLDTGCDDYVTKPIEVNKLITMIRKHL